MPEPASLRFFTDLEMNQLELRILGALRAQHPEAFSQLAEWEETCPDFPHPALTHFFKELQFYLAWLDLLDTLASTGHDCVLPALSETSPCRMKPSRSP